MSITKAAVAAAFGLIVMTWLAPPPAAAQDGPPERIRGAIESVDGQTLIIRARGGDLVRVGLADPYRVIGLINADLSGIQPGSFIGTAALPQPDGTLIAQEVLIFPEEMRGRGEGHRPWDLTPGSTMTNATVDTIVDQVKGRTLVLTHKDGRHEIVVPADAPIVTFVAGDSTLLKAGAHVFVNARRQADGSLTAGGVVVGKDGAIPPM